MERKGLTDRAATNGNYLLDGLKELKRFQLIGDVRGLGLMCAVEFIADTESKAHRSLAPAVLEACRKRGLISRVSGNSLLFAPPLTITIKEIDRILGIVFESIQEVSTSRSLELG